MYMYIIHTIVIHLYMCTTHYSDNTLKLNDAKSEMMIITHIRCKPVAPFTNMV